MLEILYLLHLQVLEIDTECDPRYCGLDCNHDWKVRFRTCVHPKTKKPAVANVSKRRLHNWGCNTWTRCAAGFRPWIGVGAGLSRC